MGACALTAFILPVSWLSWIALTAVALQILRDSSRPTPLHRGAWILLATTSAMFWGRFLLFAASDLVLQVDAFLVSVLTGTPRMGNTVQFSDGAGYVWIETACSSVHNVSLAILCWVLFAQYRDVRWSARNAAWCIAACLSVLGVNVARIALMVLHREHFDLIHGIAGASTANWLTMAAMVAICAYGTRRAVLAHE